jgi:UDP-glucose 4-epimerase
MPITTLVTGGAGFIGSHLVEHLISLGVRVTVVDSLVTGHLDNLRHVRSQIEFLQADLITILQSQCLHLEEFDCIFHLAANPYIPPSIENPAFDFHANLQTTFTLLEFLRGLEKRPRLVNVSSAAVYGNPRSLPIRETDSTVPISPYGVSKLAAECYTAIFSQIYGLHTTSLRFFSVYGPRQRKQVVFDLFAKLRANPLSIELLGDGSQMRDFTYVGDVVQSLILAATQVPGNGEAFNVATGKTHSIAELVTACCQVSGVMPRVTYTGQVRPGDAEKWSVDISALKKFGFEPQTNLLDGLTAVREWYNATI